MLPGLAMGEAEEKVEIKYNNTGSLRRKASSIRSGVCLMLADQSGKQDFFKVCFLSFFPILHASLFVRVKQKLLVCD